MARENLRHRGRPKLWRRLETGLACVLFLLLLGQLLVRLSLVDVRYDLAAVRDTVLRYDTEHRELRSSFAALTRAERLEAIAESYNLQRLTAETKRVLLVGSREMRSVP